MQKLISVIFALVLVGCGTTSGIKQGGEETLNLDFSSYNTIVVDDFGDGTKKGNLPEFAGRNFTDRIVSAIMGKGVFETVTKDPLGNTGNAIQLGGNITRYAVGNAALKFLVGMGAGSTYFDALVTFTDAQNQKLLGELVVDRNSWALGGGIAAGQTVEQFMNEAAEKIADELAKAKQGTNQN